MSLEEHRRAGEGALRFGVLTVSDSRDATTDAGGDYLVERVEAAGHAVTWRELRPDETDAIAAAVRDAVARPEVDLVLVTGGTGLAPRDVTPEALEPLFERTIPGFGELFRWLSFQEIGSATILSRALAGVVAGTPVLALPGSPKALRLALDEIVLKEAGHLVAQARGPVQEG